MVFRKLKTAVIGFGRIAQGYARDEVMAKHFTYATHAQVLAVHELFDWQAVVDPNEEALNWAREKWGIQHTAVSVDQLDSAKEIEVAVLATAPETRLRLIELFPNLKACVVEKPLAATQADAEKFVEMCRRRKILAQVNLMRRADRLTRQLALGGLVREIGEAQTVFGMYGNGLLNNGTHMVDLVRMLFGEIRCVQALSEIELFVEGPIVSDINLSFVMHLSSGLATVMHPLRFAHYRENGLDIWGKNGRLAYLHGGLTVIRYPRCDNRALSGEKEIAHDEPLALSSTIGEAMYELYSNLGAAINGRERLWSPADSALDTHRVIEAVLVSARQGGKIVSPQELLVA
ncbi:MAG: Gfo/Idh/MocA family oxidoreductase [Candidatus Melainabacteria bacterium]|nr:Gfo/Idh/MocA family oxidoreductase [Candidatus Melainabacteria bacterium]